MKNWCHFRQERLIFFPWFCRFLVLDKILVWADKQVLNRAIWLLCLLVLSVIPAGSVPAKSTHKCALLLLSRVIFVWHDNIQRHNTVQVDCGLNCVAQPCAHWPRECLAEFVPRLSHANAPQDVCETILVLSHSLLVLFLLPDGDIRSHNINHVLEILHRQLPTILPSRKAHRQGAGTLSHFIWFAEFETCSWEGVTIGKNMFQMLKL